MSAPSSNNQQLPPGAVIGDKANPFKERLAELRRKEAARGGGPRMPSVAVQKIAPEPVPQAEEKPLPPPEKKKKGCFGMVLFLCSAGITMAAAAVHFWRS